MSGEFNFAMNTPTMTFQGTAVAAIAIPPTVADSVVALRLSF
jgi:hypothetical protein